MLRIGYFSRISQVAVQTLRYYDKLGLLRPVHVDHFTSYRYYSIEQLPRLNRILALKDLGLSLNQIARMLEEDVTANEIRGMLRFRHAQLADQMQEMQAQLARVEARLRSIEQEGKMPKYDVVIKTVEPVLVAGRRILISENLNYPIGLPEAFQEVYTYTKEHRTDPKDCGIAIWYTPVDTTTNEDVEAAVPLKEPMLESERIKVHQLPQVEVASVVHQGRMKDFMQGYQALLSWIEENGYEIVGPFREVYHKFVGDRMDDVIIEIQFPVTKVDL
jgi:DNA-binding transcriptional MerR regulator